MKLKLLVLVTTLMSANIFAADLPSVSELEKLAKENDPIALSYVAVKKSYKASGLTLRSEKVEEGVDQDTFVLTAKYMGPATAVKVELRGEFLPTVNRPNLTSLTVETRPVAAHEFEKESK